MTDSLEETLGYLFTQPILLRTALTHSSFVNENPDIAPMDNERLEFLGDAVIDFIVAEWLFHEFPELSEGEMTNLRAVLVREETLANLARAISLGEAFLLGKGEEESGGRTRPHNLCAGFEALMGALYLDAGIEAVRERLIPLMRPELDLALEQQAVRDAKSMLQEWVQARYHVTPTYTTVKEEGPDHAKVFTVEVAVNGRALARGTGPNKQAAAQEAARRALYRLQSQAS